MEETAVANRVAPYRLAVIMEQERHSGRWGGERWRAVGVVRDVTATGSAEHVIVNDTRITQLLFPGLAIRLNPDEAEGYHLNITSPHPKVFVLWRMRDGVARPELLTVSYHEGARWMDAEETVDGVALPADLAPWIAAFVAAHYRPEPKQKRRYASSKDKGVASRRGGDT